MRCEPGWGNALYGAKPANPTESGIGYRDSPQRCVLVPGGTRIENS